MPHVEVMLPLRKNELVSWRVAGDGRYLVRNRATAESFQLGDQEHFLLARLDGTHTPDEICADFEEQFSLPLSHDELDEYVQLAAAQGLLQDGGSEEMVPGPLERTAAAPPEPSAKPGFWRRGAVRSLKAASTVLRWSIWLPNAVLNRMQQRVRWLEFTPRADDVFIVTYPRSGTTWMQMILYQLTTDGSMDFPHIAEFCPWFEKSVRSATAFETRPSPRLFKSHLPWRRIPKGPGRYIYVARNGRDVAMSYYHLCRMYNGYEGTFAEFFDQFLKGKTSFGCWFEHVQGWWAHRDDPHVLFLTYEELSSDLESCLRRIAAFIGQDVPSDRLPGIVERCRFAFMKQHENRFDPVMETLWEQGVQLKSFLRQGRVGDGVVSLTEEQQARFEEVFAGRLKQLGVPLS